MILEVDTDGYRQWSVTIFTCKACRYETRDLYTAGIINDQLDECPNCDADLDTFGQWTVDSSWYHS